MRKKIATIGVVILILGIGLGIGGFMAIEEMPTHTSIFLVKSGEYKTSQIIYSKGDVLIIANPSNVSGLICSSNFTQVNSSNLHNYAISPTKEISGGLEYKNIKTGLYVFVDFTSKSPANQGYTLASPAEYSTALFGEYAFTSSFFLVVAGIVVIILGLILKPKNKMPGPKLKNNKK